MNYEGKYQIKINESTFLFLSFRIMYRQVKGRHTWIMTMTEPLIISKWKRQNSLKNILPEYAQNKFWISVQGMKKLSIHLVLVLKTSHWYRFHLFICQFDTSCGINAGECFHGPVAPQQGMLGAWIVWWPASFWLQWTIARGIVHAGSPAKFTTKPTKEWKKENVCYKTN